MNERILVIFEDWHTEAQRELENVERQFKRVLAEKGVAEATREYWPEILAAGMYYGLVKIVYESAMEGKLDQIHQVRNRLQIIQNEHTTPRFSTLKEFVDDSLGAHARVRFLNSDYWKRIDVEDQE